MPNTLRKISTLLLIVSCCQSCLLLPQRTAPAAPLTFEYLTLSAALRCCYDKRPQVDARIHVRLHHDHYMGFTVTGPWGVQLLRGQATPTHVTLLYPLQQTYAIYTYDQLAARWPGPWSYAALQAWLLGEEAPQAEDCQFWTSRRLGKVTEQRMRTPMGRLVAHYGHFRPLLASFFWGKATFAAYVGDQTHHPIATLTLTNVKAKGLPQPLPFDLEIPPHYAPQP